MDQSATLEKKKNWQERIKFYIALLGIVSPLIAVATYIGIKPEKKKVLEWEYVSIGSLVNPAVMAPINELKVVFDGREIKQLTAVFGKLTNSGDVPITGSSADVEKPASLIFDSAKVKIISASISARVNSRGQSISSLKARSIVDNGVVTIEHGLLNPGDSIGVQLLLEGNIGGIKSLPPVDYRISDIRSPITKYSDGNAKVIRPAYFQFSRVNEFGILFVASLAPILFLLFCGFLVSEVWEEMFPDEEKIEKAMNTAQQSFPINLRYHVSRAEPELEGIIYNGAFREDLSWIQSNALDEFIVAKIQNLQSKFNMNASEAANKIRTAYRKVIRARLANSFYSALPPGMDARARDVVNGMELRSDHLLQDLPARAADLVRNALMPRSFFDRLRRVSKSNAFGLLAFGFMTLSLALVLVGSWGAMLSANSAQ